VVLFYDRTGLEIIELDIFFNKVIF